MDRKGPIVGQKGVKYGLQKPSAARAAAAPPPKPANAFFGDSDSDEDVNQQIVRQAEKKRQETKVRHLSPYRNPKMHSRYGV